MGLSRLNAHWADERIEALGERSESLLLHIYALEGMVVHLLLRREYFAARTHECRCAGSQVHRFLHVTITIQVHYVREASTSIAETTIASLTAAAIWISEPLLLSRSVPVPASRKNRVW